MPWALPLYMSPLEAILLHVTRDRSMFYNQPSPLKIRSSIASLCVASLFFLMRLIEVL